MKKNTKDSLKDSVKQLKEQEKHLKHLNLVLQTKNKVNRMITLEKTKENRLQGICKCLVETRGYVHAWIVQLDNLKNVIGVEGAGFNSSVKPFSDQLFQGQLTPCILTALKKSEVMVIEDRSNFCGNCVLLSGYPDTTGLVIRIEHEDQIYGVLGVSLRKGLLCDSEEISLFKEIAADIAYALYNREFKEKHKRVLEDLKDSETKYRIVIEKAAVGIALSTINGQMLEGNRRLLEILGLTQAEFRIQGLSNIYHDLSDREEVISGIKKSGFIRDYELKLKCKNEDLFDGLLSVDLIELGGKKVLLSTLQDITQQKQMAITTKESKEKLNSFINAAPIGFILFDSEFKIATLNDAALTIFPEGTSIEKMIGKNILEIAPNLKETGRYEKYVEVFKTGTPLLLEDVVPHSTFGERNLTVRAFKAGNGLGIIFVDVTKQKLLEARLKQYSEQLEEMVEQRTSELRRTQEEIEIVLDYVPGLVFYKDIENNFIRVNRNIAAGSNMTKEEMAGKSLFEIYPSDIAQAYWDDDLAVIKAGEPKLNIEEPWDTSDGQRWLSTSKIPFRDDEGKITGIVGFSSDITERKRLEKLLIQKEKLAVLGQLAGGIGHDLRNPLGAIKNAAFFLNMVLENPDSDIKDSIRIIDEEVDTSERIINSLLDYARPKEINLEKTSIVEVIQKSLSHITIPKNITINNSIIDELPIIQADSNQLSQVFINLISNAVQAMPNGGELHLSAKCQDHNLLVISIKDTGVGISEENLEKLFEPLFTTKTKGIGLGLVISKTIVERHHGSIRVQSGLERGTAIIVKIPLKHIRGN